jgi:hypothetical protein
MTSCLTGPWDDDGRGGGGGMTDDAGVFERPPLASLLASNDPSPSAATDGGEALRWDGGPRGHRRWGLGVVLGCRRTGTEGKDSFLFRSGSHPAFPAPFKGGEH